MNVIAKFIFTGLLISQAHAFASNSENQSLVFDFPKQSIMLDQDSQAQFKARASLDPEIKALADRFKQAKIPARQDLLGNWTCEYKVASGFGKGTENWHFYVTEGNDFLYANFPDGKRSYLRTIFSGEWTIGLYFTWNLPFGWGLTDGQASFRHEQSTDLLVMEISAQTPSILIFQDLIADRSSVNSDYHIVYFGQCRRL